MSISMISEYCSLSAVSEMADSEYELRYACPAATESATQPLQSSECKHLRAQTVAIKSALCNATIAVF